MAYLRGPGPGTQTHDPKGLKVLGLRPGPSPKVPGLGPGPRVPNPKIPSLKDPNPKGRNPTVTSPKGSTEGPGPKGPKLEWGWCHQLYVLRFGSRQTMRE